MSITNVDIMTSNLASSELCPPHIGNSRSCYASWRTEDDIDPSKLTLHGSILPERFITLAVEYDFKTARRELFMAGRQCDKDTSGNSEYSLDEDSSVGQDTLRRRLLESHVHVMELRRMVASLTCEAVMAQNDSRRAFIADSAFSSRSISPLRPSSAGSSRKSGKVWPGTEIHSTGSCHSGAPPTAHDSLLASEDSLTRLRVSTQPRRGLRKAGSSSPERPRTRVERSIRPSWMVWHRTADGASQVR